MLDSFKNTSLIQLFFGPWPIQLMFERMKIEKEEGRGITAEQRSSRTEDHQQQRSAHDPNKRSSTATTDSQPTQTQLGTEHDNAVRARIIKLNNKLKKLNSYSSLLNILNLMSLTWHLVYLAQRVHHPC